MKQTPCEYMMWNGLPVIRKEIAESMINNFGLNQRQTAQKLGVTPAAVCQYLSKKRGKIKIVDESVLVEINKSAKKIIQQEDGTIISETCRICKILMKKRIFPLECESCYDEE
jgi:predicted transcriptional regulator